VTKKLTLIGFVLYWVIAILSKGFAGSVPDTGQIICYDNEGKIRDCPTVELPFYGQDANYTINPPSFTKLDSKGSALPDSALSWVMIRDNVTGLIWEVKTNRDWVKDYDNPHDADNIYSWYDPDPNTNGGNPGTPAGDSDTNDFINALNNAQFGGHSDWRMPSRKELLAIANYQTSDPSIDKDYFLNTLSAGYWSSTTRIEDPEYAWGINLFYGRDYYSGKSDKAYVRAVRGEDFQNHFIDKGDGTILDTFTGLMWQKYPAQDEWEDALSYCDDLDLGGHQDWRLPTLKELDSILDLSRFDPAINPSYFPNTLSFRFWSSTTHITNDIHAWTISIYEGSNFDHIKTKTNYVKAVRGGQNGPSPLYVEKSGTCGGELPCYDTIQKAIDAATNGTVVEIAGGTFQETPILNAPKNFSLRGGWDSSFKNRHENTILRNAPLVLKGSLTLLELSIEPSSN